MTSKWTLIDPNDPSTFPPIGQPILMRTTSSKSPPFELFYQSGFYDPNFTPLQVLFSSVGQPLFSIDDGPINWILISDLEKGILTS
jgi:hypothetical protein